MMGMRWRNLMTACASTTLLVCLSCGPSPSVVRIQITPADGAFDDSLAVTLTGLPAQATVSISADTVDYRGHPWQSVAQYTSDGTGRLDLTRVRPIGGSYDVAAGAGLIWSLAPTRDSDRKDGYFPPASGMAIHLEVRVSGSVVASGTARRSWGRGVRRVELRPPTDRLYGNYFAPASTHAPGPAILWLGGSGPGLADPVVSSLMAAHGISTLSLAYFGVPGLPTALQEIPLEYFAAAIGWLQRQPGVDPHGIWIMGMSRGSEAALLTAAHYSSLVHGVVVLAPSGISNCSEVDCGASWSLGGLPLPFTQDFGNPNPDNTAAVIPVERIEGPILLICGGADQVWPSCGYAVAIDKRLALSGFAHEHRVLRYPLAGHALADPAPNLPEYQYLEQMRGVLPWSNALARMSAWPAILEFVRSA